MKIKENLFKEIDEHLEYVAWDNNDSSVVNIPQTLRDGAKAIIDKLPQILLPEIVLSLHDTIYIEIMGKFEFEVGWVTASMYTLSNTNKDFNFEKIRHTTSDFDSDIDICIQRIKNHCNVPVFFMVGELEISSKDKLNIIINSHLILDKLVEFDISDYDMYPLDGDSIVISFNHNNKFIYLQMFQYETDVIYLGQVEENEKVIVHELGNKEKLITLINTIFEK